MARPNQKKPEDRIRFLELESIYDSAPVGLCVFDDQLRYVRINERLAEINGIPPEKHIGRTVREIVPDLAEKAEAIYREIKETGNPVLDIEFEGITSAQPGIVRTWNEQWLPLKDRSGTIRGINVVVEEITEQKQISKELYTAKTMSEALDHINETLHSTLVIDEIVQRLISEGAKVLGSDTGFVSLHQDDGLTISHVYGIPNTMVGRYMQDAEHKHALLALQSHQPVSVDDAFNDKRFNREHMRQWNVRSVLVAPLIIHNQPFGVIFFNYHTGKHTFTEAEVNFVRRLAATASIALENARLFADLQGREKELRNARDKLEVRVQERTFELFSAIKDLEEEVTERKRAEEKLRHLSNRLLEAQETERKNIAFELHDSIGSSLTGIKMAMEVKLDGMQQRKEPSKVIALEEILDLLKECIQDIKRIERNLRPAVLDRLGLAPALRSLSQEFEGTYRDITTTCTVAIDDVEIPEDLKITIYRISQEALTNAAKHSEATNADLSLIHHNGEIQLTIRDDGYGFDTAEGIRPETNGHGIGLASMKERCELSGGSFSIDSQEGEGTTVCANWVCA